MADAGETRAVAMPNELLHKFAAVRKRVRAVILAKGWALLVFAACVCFGLSIVLDRLLFLRSRYRLALFVASVGAMTAFLVAYLLIPLMRKMSARRIARTVEDRYPELKDLLLSTVELSEESLSGETYTSRELIEAVTRETVGRTRDTNFRGAVPFSAVRRPLLIAAVVMCGLATYCYLRPMIAANVLQRLLFPYSGPPPLTFTELTVSPGDSLVPKGTDVEIEAVTEGRIPRKAVLYLGRKEGQWDKVVLRPRRRGEFAYVLKGQLRPVDYRFRAGDARSETFTISVAERPVIVEMEVGYAYPEYTGLKPETKSGSGEIAAVKGSKVRITAKSNKELRGAKVKFSDGSQSLVLIRGATLHSQEFEVTRNDSYSMELLDVDGFASDGAITHPIRALEDKTPTVGITSPDTYSHARPDEIVPIDFRAVDDFAIEKVWLEYTVRGAEPKEEKDKVETEERRGVLSVSEEVRGGGSLIEGEYGLPLADLEAKEGELVVFRIGAQDNNSLSGPGKGFSSEHTIRIVSEEASYKTIEQEQQDLSRRLLRLIKMQKGTQSVVETLRQELRGEASPSEAEKASLETVKSEQGAVEEEGRRLSVDFAETLQKMRDNPLIQPRTLIETAQVAKVLGELSRKEMPAATQKAFEAARSKDPAQRETKLTETSDLQKDIIEALEGLSKEFARIQDEQRLFALAEAARRLAREQLEARTSTISALPELAGLFPERLTPEQKRRLRKLVEDQQKLKEKLSEFEERMRKLSKQLEYANSPEAKTVASALQFFEQSDGQTTPNIPKDASDAIDALRANHLHKGTGLQGRVYESLVKLAQEFDRVRKMRFQGEYSNAAQAFELQQPEIDKLIEFQKGIIKDTEELPGRAEEGVDWAEVGKFEKVSQAEKTLLNRTSNYRAILQEVFERLSLVGVDPVTPLKGAEEAMAKAAGSLEELKAGEGLAQERDSLRNLEMARDELARALATMMSSAGLQQAMQAMSALDRMIQQQRKVNEGTKGLDERAGEESKLTDPMLETLRQLINDQAGLQQQAQSLKNYLKMMLKAGDMMGQSMQRLTEKQTGQPTQQLQSQILELLTQMRVTLQSQADAMAQAMGLPGASGTGAQGGIMTEPILRGVPQGMDDRWANLPPRMKQELLEAWTETFSPEFRDLIALYYKRLSGEEGSE